MEVNSTQKPPLTYKGAMINICQRLIIPSWTSGTPEGSDFTSKWQDCSPSLLCRVKKKNNRILRSSDTPPILSTESFND